MLFEAKFKKYWCDACQEFERFDASSIRDILEHAYKYYINSPYPRLREIRCLGARDGLQGGFLNVNCALPQKGGFRGSVWLESITCWKDGKAVVVFSRADRYISPKTAEIFNNFAEEVKQREPQFGEF